MSTGAKLPNDSRRIRDGPLSSPAFRKEIEMKSNAIQALHVHALTAQERFVDRLADLMLDTDELLELIRAGDSASIRWAEPHLQIVYNEINGVMQRMCD